MKHFICPFMTLTGITLLPAVSAGQTVEKPPVKNVLFIAIDDLRTALHCYGESQMITPNIDRLAGEGVVFDSHYCSVPFSGPSRASMWTGLYPTADRFTNFARAQDQVPNVTVMPQHFKNQGYRTVSLGKVFHHHDDFADAWDVLDTEGNYFGYQDPANQKQQAEDQKTAARNIASVDFDDLSSLPKDFQAPQGPAFECVDVPDEAYTDGKSTLAAIAELEKARESGQPLFLAVGYYRPHSPFIAPKKYWDMYDYDRIEATDNPLFPKNAPEEARQSTEELYMTLSGIPHYKNIGDSLARKIKHGYYAGVTYTDAQIGKLMDAIDRLGLRENTVVVIWGDNGYLLGEHAGWTKLSHFYEALRVPLIISAPGMARNKRSAGLTESVDLYPTVCELAGLGQPSHVQGKSMVPILKNPEARMHEVVFSRLNNGESVRTTRYLYTEWTPADSTKSKVCMLYDMEKDPDERENIAGLPENKEIVARHAALIAAHKAEVARMDSQHDYGEPNPNMSTNPFN